ncbi:MFS transporter [Myxococcota bacterium]|nr:MFS transporter [Myxococcota bacterium]
MTATAHPHRVPHPVVYTILYFPFGALGGFVTVALTFLGTRHGLSITESAFLGAAGLMMNWLKWIWAPLVDTTLTPKRWYYISALGSSVGVAAIASIPLGPETLPLLLAVIAAANLVNSMVGMAVEALMAQVTPVDQIGRVSAWFQAGNLGGAGIGGGVGLLLLNALPEAWMTGLIFAVLFAACCLALRALPDLPAEGHGQGPKAAIGQVFANIRGMTRTQGGLASAILCFLPIGTGAAQGVLTQSAVAEKWGAGEHEVALVQGVMAGLINGAGCFMGGWLCMRFPPRAVYAAMGLSLAIVAGGMAALPMTPATYVGGNVVYSLGVGLSYAAFTAVVLDAIGPGSAATKYTLYATLSNFPIWWVGLLLGYVADVKGADGMLYTEAGLGIGGIAVFLVAAAGLRRTSLPPR